MYRRIVLGDSSSTIPADPLVQLHGAIQAVFASWNSPRAVAYRRHHGLDDAGGTAVVIQAMVFGNLPRDSGTGVLFSRNPATGADEPMGEWLPGAQGEDVVSGTFDCLPLDALRTAQPRVFDELMAAAVELERLGRDVQDIEFTVEEGRLWLLQTRAAKRSPQAAVRLALRFRDAGLIDDAEALRRVTPEHLRSLLSPSLQPEARLAATLLAKGLPSSPGVASGTAHADIDTALDAADEGEDVILVRTSTSPRRRRGDDRRPRHRHGTRWRDVPRRRRQSRARAARGGGCGAGVAAALDGRQITVDGGTGEVYDGILELTAWSERDSPDLVAFAAIANRVSPLRDAPLLAMLAAVQLAERSVDG